MSSGTILLRCIAVGIGLLLLVFAYTLDRIHEPDFSRGVLVFDAALIIGGTLFERQRYRPKIDAANGEWTKTGEKFKDPTTGKLMEVVYNPQTGERDYLEV